MNPQAIANFVRDILSPVLLLFVGQEFGQAISRLWRWMTEALWKAQLFFRLLWHHDFVVIARGFHQWVLGATTLIVGLSAVAMGFSSEECGPHHYPWPAWLILLLLPAIFIVKGSGAIFIDSDVRPIDWSFVEQRIAFRKRIADAAFRMPTIPPGSTSAQIQALEEPVLRQRADELRRLLEGPNGIGPEIEARCGASNRSPLPHAKSAIVTTFAAFVSVAVTNLLFVGGSWRVEVIFMDLLTLAAIALAGLMSVSVSFYFLLTLNVMKRIGTFFAHLVDGILVQIATIPPGITDENVRSVIGTIDGQFLADAESEANRVTFPSRIANLMIAAMAIWAHLGVLMMFAILVLGIGAVVGFFRPAPAVGSTAPAAPPPLTFVERAIQAIVITAIVIRLLLTYANRYLGYPLHKLGAFLVSVANYVTGLGSLDHGPDPGDYLVLAGRLAFVYGVGILVLAALIVGGVLLAAAHRSRDTVPMPVRIGYGVALAATFGWLGLMGIGSSGHGGFANPFPIPTCDARATLIARTGGTTPAVSNPPTATGQPTTVIHYPPLPPLPPPAASPQSGHGHRGHHGHHGDGSVAVGIDTVFSCTPRADAPSCSEIMPYNRQALRETCGCR